MTDYLPKEVLAGLEEARRQDRRKKARLRVHAGEDIFVVHRLWDDGFAVDAEDAPHLRGLVDIYEGSRHLWQCLIVASEEEAGEMIYEFKRHTAAEDRAPLDFAREDDAPVALIPRD
jgi:hypothetical protein